MFRNDWIGAPIVVKQPNCVHCWGRTKNAKKWIWRSKFTAWNTNEHFQRQFETGWYSQEFFNFLKRLNCGCKSKRMNCLHFYPKAKFHLSWFTFIHQFHSSDISAASEELKIFRCLTIYLCTRPDVQFFDYLIGSLCNYSIGRLDIWPFVRWMTNIYFWCEECSKWQVKKFQKTWLEKKKHGQTPITSTNWICEIVKTIMDGLAILVFLSNKFRLEIA